MIKDLEPDGDPGRFNLQIDGTTEEGNAGDGGTTTALPFNTGTHSVGETAGTGTSLDDYEKSISAEREGAPGLDLGRGPAERHPGRERGHRLHDHQHPRDGHDRGDQGPRADDGDPGRFNLQIDGTTEEGNAGDGGTTTALPFNTGTHSVGETAGTGTSLDDYEKSISCANGRARAARPRARAR